MSANGQPAPIPIYEDCGIGFCVRCLAEYKAGTRQSMPNWAITLVGAPGPVLDPLGNAAGMVTVAVPACWDHLGATSKTSGRLVVPGAGLS